MGTYLFVYIIARCTVFDENNCLRKLSQQGDQLEKLNRVIEWRIFYFSSKPILLTLSTFSRNKMSLMKTSMTRTLLLDAKFESLSCFFIS